MPRASKEPLEEGEAAALAAAAAVEGLGGWAAGEFLTRSENGEVERALLREAAARREAGRGD